MARYLAPMLLALSMGSAAACSPDRTVPNLSGARSIRIEDNWEGLSPISPISAVFSFIREGDRVRATADFSVQSGEEVLHQNVPQLDLPVERFETFLGAISEVEIKSSPYDPTFTHTDDYPSITIEVEGGGGPVTFFTRSQGERHTPWAVRIEGADFVLTSDSPQQALDLLEPYLKWDVLEKLKRDALESFEARRSRR